MIIMCLYFRGTEMQHVADDYAARLHAGSMQCQSLANDVLSSAMAVAGGVFQSLMVHCEYLNISMCYITEEATQVNISLA